MSYTSMSGLGAFGGTFAPDCYLAGGRPNMLGTPMSAAQAAAYTRQYGPSAEAVVAICQQSADPVTCAAQNFLTKPFLGRPCQNEWRAWIQEKLVAGGASAAAAAQITAPPPPDNTMLYVGVGAVAVVGVGAALFFRKKR